MVKANVFELLQACWNITHKIGMADKLQKCVTEKTPYWNYSFSSNPCALVPVLSHAGSAPLEKNVAYNLKYTWQPSLKALTFKSIILFHSYNNKKLQNRK